MWLASTTATSSGAPAATIRPSGAAPVCRIKEFYPQLQMQTDIAKYKDALKSSQNILSQSQMQNRVYIAHLGPI
jgi:hypothetical protein